jgi:ankyrin repeat protein
MSKNLLPINLAMETKDYTAVKLLAEHGVNLNTRGTDSQPIVCVNTYLNSQSQSLTIYNDGYTVLELAIQHRKKSLIKLLLAKGADPYLPRKFGYYLYNYPPTDPSYKGLYEKSSGNVVYVFKERHPETNAVKELITASDLEILAIFAGMGVDFNKSLYFGESTPLQFAHHLKNKEVMQFLLDHGAKI